MVLLYKAAATAREYSSTREYPSSKNYSSIFTARDNACEDRPILSAAKCSAMTALLSV